MNQNELSAEWITLQASCDRFEIVSMGIKLIAVILFFAGEILASSPLWLGFIVMILWFQEAIWKTFLSRTESRIMKVEAMIAEDNEATGFQFHSQWASQRPSTKDLILSYFSHAAKPTVAFPYVVLLGALLI